MDLDRRGYLADRLGLLQVELSAVQSDVDATKAAMLEEAGDYMAAPVKFSGAYYAYTVGKGETGKRLEEGLLRETLLRLDLPVAVVEMAIDASKKPGVGPYPVIRPSTLS